MKLEIFHLKQKLIVMNNYIIYINKYFRSLHRKLFKRIMIHLYNDINIDKILRFILSEINNNKIINGDILFTKASGYNAEQYRHINKKFF